MLKSSLKNHDFAKVKLGNYINLPYHGDARPILRFGEDGDAVNYALEAFIEEAEEAKNSPQNWRAKAQWMMVKAPEDRPQNSQYGKQQALHICAKHVLSGAAGPVTEGGRHVVYFCLAKMLLNCEHYDLDETVELLRALNEDSSPDTLEDQELLRIIGNAERGQYTSTGCDDPLFIAYAHPDCRIAYPRR